MEDTGLKVSELKFLVAGCGSIGRRHIRNLATLGARRFVLCDLSHERLDTAAHGLDAPVLTDDFESALEEGADVALICTPSSLHLEMALKAARSGMHLFIEKPLSDTLAGVDELLDVVERNNVTAMIAMCYRFHPVLRRLKEMLDSRVVGRLYHVNGYGGHYLPDWHPNEDYRKEYAARKDLGGGVVLTSIHGLDNIRWLFGEVRDMYAFVDRVGNLEMDVEDMALGIFRLDNGTYVSWQTDFLQRADQHRLVVVGERGTIRCDVLEGRIDTFLVDTGGWETETVPFETNTMYVREMQYFLECLEKRMRPVMDVVEGYRTLKLALDIKECGANLYRGEGERRCLTV